MNRGSNRLAALAAEIQEADGRCRRNAEQAAAAAIEAGHKLIEAKGLLRHGEWLPWLRDRAAISERTARRYMQLARSGVEIGHVADLGIAGAVRHLARHDQALDGAIDAAIYFHRLTGIEPTPHGVAALLTDPDLAEQMKRFIALCDRRFVELSRTEGAE